VNRLRSRPSRRRSRRPSIGAVVAAALGPFLLGLGCSKKEAAPTPLPPAPSATAVAADRLAPGELAEGHERVMGLAVPRDMRLLRVFDDSAVARGRVGAEALSNYVRQRVDVAGAEIGAARTVFPKAHVKGQPDEKVVRIEVVPDIDSTELWLRDLTPPPVLPGLSEEERWKRAGVIPGKPLDPNAL
jgi:hypothetical protein